MKLYDHWNANTGTAWRANRWVTNSNGSTRILDVEGRLYVGGSTVRGTSTAPTSADHEVTLTYRFSDRTSGSDFRIYLRGYGASPTSQMPNGYRLDIDSSSPTIKLKKVVGGTASTIGQFDYNPPDPNAAQRLRFRVRGSQVAVDIWPASQPEGETWDLDVTNTAVSGEGVLQVTHYQSSGTPSRSVYIDDLMLFNLPSTDTSQTLQENDHVPAPGSHATKIYISPADHLDQNIGCGGFNETDAANLLANDVAQVLKNRGYYVRVGFSDFGPPKGAQEKAKSSNNWGPAAHIPIHSNADPSAPVVNQETGERCSPQSVGGTQMLVNMADQRDIDLSNTIFNHLHPQLIPSGRPGSPGTSDGLIDRRDLAETAGIGTAAAGYIERAFHTNPADVDWMRNEYGDIALAIAQAIDAYFTFPEPRP